MNNAEKATYEMLKRNGHSPTKAAEIILDIKRGDKYATYWVDTINWLNAVDKYNEACNIS